LHYFFREEEEIVESRSITSTRTSNRFASLQMDLAIKDGDYNYNIIMKTMKATQIYLIPVMIKLSFWGISNYKLLSFYKLFINKRKINTLDEIFQLKLKNNFM